MASSNAPNGLTDPGAHSAQTMKIENTEKRDTLIESEKKYQQQWQEEKIFEPDAPSLEEFPYGTSSKELHEKYPKFHGTMAYPYMNGTLHMGHAFTATKIEFAAGFARMQGKRTLFPQGFHCTGLPIKACADKLVREVEMFGKNFEKYDEQEMADGMDKASLNTPAPMQETTKEDVTKFAAKKGKAAAKSVKAKYQFQIMLSNGTPREDIHKFADARTWLDHFPKLCKQHLTNFGFRIDWRRQFVTTDANAYYDAFVRWQMNRLHEMGKVKFGKRYTIYSPADSSACMDHDRSVGEGVGVQEYLGIKLKVKTWSETALKKVDGKVPKDANVFFVPATLRPETMYGQNCCFVGPKIKYGIFHVSGNDYFFISDRAARNMAFQNIFPTWGKFPKIAELEGSDVVGTLVNAPLSVHKDGVRILPMESVNASKGTGVVTSVPSDSPDDYATITDLAKKADYYGIKKEWAELEIIPIIDTPTYGSLTAPELVKRMKINSPKDVKQLAEAKEIAYKEGYYKGTMIYGDFKGKSVEEAKPLVRQALIDASEAFNYAEPNGEVISRSGDVCVAAHIDQWYMNYGTEEKGGDGKWHKQVKDWLNSELNTYSTEAKNAFEQVLDWLANWACTREYGLGSRLPWDKHWLVESLSDSTIYMSYYTIAHLLHKDIFGKEVGSANIKPEQMTDEVWDYVFCRRDKIDTDIPEKTLHLLRRNFEYWYPLDARISGKDLIGNHLTFFLYNHLAIFRQEYWPRSIRVNGHLLLNGEKMSKSTGNFLSLQDALNKFGADATRIALADAGDAEADANFEESGANASILRLYELRKWCEEMIRDAHVVSSPKEYAELRSNGRIKNIDVVQRSGPKIFWDELFENELNELVSETYKQYEATMYKAALKSGLYDFNKARDDYREATKAAGVGMHKDVIRRFVELQSLMLTPIAPHWAEYMWREVLGKKTTIQNELFPKVPGPDPRLTAALSYVRTTKPNITSAEGQQQKRMAKNKNVKYNPNEPKALTIFTASSFPKWQEECISIMSKSHKDKKAPDMKEVSKVAGKKGPPFIQGLKRRLDAGESPDTVLSQKLPFSEVDVLKEMAPWLRQIVPKCSTVTIVQVEEGGKAGQVVGGTAEDVKVGEKRTELPQEAENAVPGQPTFHFANVS